MTSTKLLLPLMLASLLAAPAFGQARPGAGAGAGTIAPGASADAAANAIVPEASVAHVELFVVGTAAIRMPLVKVRCDFDARGRRYVTCSRLLTASEAAAVAAIVETILPPPHRPGRTAAIRPDRRDALLGRR